MAPEVYHGTPYGKPADVFSFAIIAWEVLTLQTPFEKETRESHARKVYGRMEYRPKIKMHWPLILQQLIRDCWSGNVATRPSFDHIEVCLEQSKLVAR